MRDNTLTALRYLYFYGPCYKSDFMKMLGKRGGSTFDRLSKQIKKERGDDGFIEREVEVDGEKRQAHQTATIVALSKTGISFYKDYEHAMFEDFASENTNLINTNGVRIKRELHPHLAEQKAFIMYYLAGAYCFSFQKPSLGYLVYYLTDNALSLDKIPYKDNYLDKDIEPHSLKAKQEMLKKFIKVGAYYTKKEVIEFLKLRGKNFTDSFKGLSWQGLFVSDTNMLVNFVLSSGRNTRAYPNSKMLGSFLQKLTDNLAIATHVNRRIKGLVDDPSTRNIYENKIDALTIGIGSSHTYSEAMGNKYGLIKKRDMTTMASDNRQRDILDCTSSRFSRIYSIDDRELGVEMLYYITTYSLEDYHQEQIELFTEDNRFSLNNSSYSYPADYKPLNVQAIYMPVYEIKLLKKIADRAKKDYPIVIATKKEMMETISHCVHIESVSSISTNKPRQAGLWFVEFNTRISEDGSKEIYLGDFIDESSGVFNIYDNKGYIKGKRMINDYLQEKGIQLASEGEYIKLAKLCFNAYSKSDSNFQIKCKFYNCIARSSAGKYLDPYIDKLGQDKNAQVKTDLIVPKEKSRRRRYNERINISITNADRNRVNKLASSMSMKTSSIIRKTFLSILDEVESLSSKQNISIDEAYNKTMNILHRKRNE